MSPVAWMSPAVTAPGPVFLSVRRFGPSPWYLDGDVLDVEDDVGHVLAHAGDRRELVQHAVDVNRRDRRALQGRQQNAAQRVAERHAEAALQRLGDGGRDALGIVSGGDFELVRLDEFLPVLLDAHLEAFP